MVKHRALIFLKSCKTAPRSTTIKPPAGILLLFYNLISLVY